MGHLNINFFYPIYPFILSILFLALSKAALELQPSRFLLLLNKVLFWLNAVRW